MLQYKSSFSFKGCAACDHLINYTMQNLLADAWREEQIRRVKQQLIGMDARRMEETFRLCTANDKVCHRIILLLPTLAAIAFFGLGEIEDQIRGLINDFGLLDFFLEHKGYSSIEDYKVDQERTKTIMGYDKAAVMDCDFLLSVLPK
jgi:hypothetical protein